MSAAAAPSRLSGPLVVVGGALLDLDLHGTARRLTPDAPVPVLEDLVEHARPGGAGLAALMAAREGHEVVLVTAIGSDSAGERLEELLAAVSVVRLPYDGPTTVKERIRAAGQSLLRLDRGTRLAPVGDPPASAVAALRGAGAVLVADYGRGISGVPALREALTALPRHVPLTWDPHPRGSRPVPGVRLATPNFAEAAAFTDGTDACPGGSLLTLAGRRAESLVRQWQAQAVAVTLGARGALLSYGEGTPVVTPAPSVTASDPCGAGDRFAVSAALALGAGSLATEAVATAVADAAAYVAAGGPASLADETARTSPAGAPVDRLLADMRARGATVVATGGCFDLLHAGHVATLRDARRLGDCLVVCVNSDASVRRLKGPGRPLVPAEDRVRVLEALEFVDAVVVFEEDTPVEVLGRIRPDVWAKGGDYAGSTVPEGAVMAQWGGQVVALPYLQGRSTTRLVRSAARRRPAEEAHAVTTPHTDKQTDKQTDKEHLR